MLLPGNRLERSGVLTRDIMMGRAVTEQSREVLHCATCRGTLRVTTRAVCEYTKERLGHGIGKFIPKLTALMTILCCHNQGEIIWKVHVA